MAITASHRGRSRSRCFVPAVSSASGLSRHGARAPAAGTRVMRKLVRQPATATVVSTTPIFHSAVFHAVNRKGPTDVPSTMATSVAWMFVVLFLMAVHYTVFSPAKYSIVPELVSDRDLSRANALLEMTTLVAIVLGTSIGPFLFTAWKTAEWKIGVVLTTVAVVGCLTSFRITRVPASGSKEPLRLNPLAEVTAGTKHLLRDRPLWLAVLALSYFWFLGLL